MQVDPDSPEARGAAAEVIPAAKPGDGAGTLDRRRVLGAAVALVDRDGLRSLTMRKLGAYLRVEAMAIYHYVHSREELLDGIVETVLDELYGDPYVYMSSPDWQEFMYRLAHGVRRIALAHPEVFPLIATRPPAAPWVHPPLRSLRWMESFLKNLLACGFSNAGAVAAYQAFSSFLLGHLLLEVSSAGVDIGPIDEPDPTPPNPTDLADYPVLAQLQNEISQNHAAQEFEESLEALLDRLETIGKRGPR